MMMKKKGACSKECVACCVLLCALCIADWLPRGGLSHDR